MTTESFPIDKIVARYLVEFNIAFVFSCKLEDGPVFEYQASRSGNKKRGVSTKLLIKISAYNTSLSLDLDYQVYKNGLERFSCKVKNNKNAIDYDYDSDDYDDEDLNNDCWRLQTGNVQFDSKRSKDTIEEMTMWLDSWQESMIRYHVASKEFVIYKSDITHTFIISMDEAYGCFIDLYNIIDVCIRNHLVEQVAEN